MTGNYRFADKVFCIQSIYPDVHEYCRDYRTDNTADFEIKITQEMINYEKERSIKTDLLEKRTPIHYPDGYLEELAVYRQIAEAMPEHDTFLFHGSVVAVDSEAFLFTAPSGTGKSTHSRLWREYLGERAVMVNDDKPLIRVTDDHAIAYGTPYNGKHRLGSDIAVPLKAICVLTRDKQNHIQHIDFSDAYPILVQQIYRPHKSETLIKTLELLDRLAQCVEFYRMGCNMDIQAAKVAYNAMKG